MLLNNSTKKIGAVFCATVMLFLMAQTVISNDNQKTWEFLRSIKGKFKLGILSDNSVLVKNEWLHILDLLKTNVFDEFMVSEEIGVEKPDQLMFVKILEKLNSLMSLRQMILMNIKNLSNLKIILFIRHEKKFY